MEFSKWRIVIVLLFLAIFAVQLPTYYPTSDFKYVDLKQPKQLINPEIETSEQDKGNMDLKETKKQEKRVIDPMFFPEKDNTTRLITDCKGSRKWKTPQNAQFPERRLNTSITFEPVLVNTGNISLPFTVTSPFSTPVLQLRLTCVFKETEQLFRRFILSDGTKLTSQLFPQQTVSTEFFSMNKVNQEYVLNLVVGEDIPLVSSNHSFNFVIKVDVRLDYKSLEASLSDIPDERLHSFIGSKERSYLLHFEATQEILQKLADKHLSHWFITSSTNLTTPTRDLFFNYEAEDMLKPSCHGFIEKLRKKRKYWKKGQSTMIELIFYGDSQPSMECDYLRKVLGIPGPASKPKYIQIFPSTYLTVKCGELRYPTDNRADLYLDLYRKWLEGRLLIPSDIAIEKKLVINFSGIHDNYCANLGVFNKPEIYEKVIKDLIQVTVDVSKESLYPVDIFFMGTTLTQNIVWSKNWYMSQTRVEYMNALLEREIKKLDNFHYIDIGYYSRIAEFDIYTDADVRHLSDHANMKILDLILCRTLFDRFS